MFYQSLVIFNSTNITSFTRIPSFGQTGHAGWPATGGRSGDTAERVANFAGWFTCEVLNPASKCQSVVQNIHNGYEGKLSWDGMYKEHEKQRLSKEREFIEHFKHYENEQRYKLFKIMFELETSFLDFAIQSKLETSFLSSIIDQNHFDLTLECILKRIQILNKYRYRTLLPNLQHEILNYSNKNEIDVKEKLALNYSYTAISSFILRFDIAKDSIFVVNIEEFIRDKKKEIENWTQLDGQQVRHAYKENYQNSLKNRIIESDNIIESLQKEIEVEENRMNDELRNVIKQIKEMKEQSQENEKLILNYREASKKEFKLKMFFFGAKTICKFLKFAGPKVAIVGTALNGVFEISEALIVKEREKPKIPDSVKALANNIIALKNKRANGKRKRDEGEKSEENEKENDEMIEEVSNVVVGLVQNFKNFGEEADEINSLLNENANYIVALGEIEHKITYLEGNILNDFKATQASLKNSQNSGSLNIFKKWELSRNLEDMKQNLNPLIKSLDSNENINLIINRIDSLVDTFMEIYQQIDKYKYQIDLASFVEAMTRNTDSEMDRFRNEDKKSIYMLKNMLHQSLIVEQYHLAIQAFHYWSYPFECEYEVKIRTRNVENEKNTDSLRNEIKIKLENIEKIISNQKSTIDIGIDKFIMRSTFDKLNPYYKWSSKKYDREIKKLLSGDEATFFSDVSETVGKEAIKFNRVYITIEFISSKTKNQTLNNLLVECDIKLTHSGRSFFKYDNSINEISSNLNGHQFVLIYDYKSFGNGDRKNEIYKKLKDNEPLLSPYTYWNIKINPSYNNEDLLKQMAGLYKSKDDEIVISLCGDGKYVQEAYKRNLNLSICNNLLNPLPQKITHLSQFFKSKSTLHSGSHDGSKNIYYYCFLILSLIYLN